MTRKPLSVLAFVALVSCGGGTFHTHGGGEARLPVLEKAKQNATRSLSSDAATAVERDGFVIVPSATAPSFHFGYSALFEADQPVYITADAILHAVHASFDDVLADIETQALIGELDAFLDEIRTELPKHETSTSETRADMDRFIAVAKSLLHEEPAPPVAGADPAAIATLVGHAVDAKGPIEVSLFGEDTLIDFSMMKPRGHYTKLPALKRYFRALSWLGRVELRIAMKSGSEEMKVNRRALTAAVLLSELMTPRASTAWKRIDRAMDLLVGPADSMALTAFGKARQDLSLTSDNVASIAEAPVLEALTPLSEQRINTQLLTPFESTLPLWVFGQRYVADSHVMSATSYGKLPQKRMMPSALDVAAAIFENPEATVLLEKELETYSSLGPALERVKNDVNAMGPELWQGSMSHLWLDALRKLTPKDKAGLPKTLTTPAWDRRMLNTQLASWAERRHDTILYAKQSVTAIAGCSFPQAYVDPYPDFYARLIELASLGRTLHEELELTGPRGDRIAAYFEKLATVLGTLKAISSDERAGQPMSEEHLDFLNHAVSVHGERVGSGWGVAYTIGGWFADLYYSQESAKFHKPTIVDVHTQPTDGAGNPVGKVLHVGTGRPQLIEVRLDVDGVQRSYRGFVSSYYEVVTRNFERHDDAWMREQVREETLTQIPWLADIAPAN